MKRVLLGLLLFGMFTVLPAVFTLAQAGGGNWGDEDIWVGSVNPWIIEEVSCFVASIS